MPLENWNHVIGMAWYGPLGPVISHLLLGCWMSHASPFICFRFEINVYEQKGLIYVHMVLTIIVL